MIDGSVSRYTHTESKMGERLDSAADFIFVAVCFVKLLPYMNLPLWMWVWIAVIFAINVSNIIAGFVYRKKLIYQHTKLKKLTGLLLFLMTFLFRFVEIRYPAIVVCTTATIAAIQEGYLMITNKRCR